MCPYQDTWGTSVSLERDNQGATELHRISFKIGLTERNSVPVGLAMLIESPTESYDLAVQETLLNASTQVTSSTGPGLFPDPLDPDF